MSTFFVGPGFDNADDGDDTWLFKAFNNLGDDSSLLLRPMRRLIASRRPPGIVTPLALFLDGRSLGYFGAIYSGRDRVCFYPAYPSGTDMLKHIDHVTLETGNGTSHATRYDADGTPHRFTPTGYAWHLCSFPVSKAAMWFQFLMPLDTLDKQNNLLQRGVDGISQAGGEHVRQAFLDYATAVQRPVSLHAYTAEGATPSYALCWLFYGYQHPLDELGITPEMLTLDGVANSVTGFDDQISIQTRPVAFTRAGHSFVAAVACPPGEIAELAGFGFPRVNSAG